MMAQCLQETYSVVAPPKKGAREQCPHRVVTRLDIAFRDAMIDWSNSDEALGKWFLVESETVRPMERIDRYSSLKRDVYYFSDPMSAMMFKLKFI